MLDSASGGLQESVRRWRSAAHSPDRRAQAAQRHAPQRPPEPGAPRARSPELATEPRPGRRRCDHHSRENARR